MLRPFRHAITVRPQSAASTTDQYLRRWASIETQLRQHIMRAVCIHVLTSFPGVTPRDACTTTPIFPDIGKNGNIEWGVFFWGEVEWTWAVVGVARGSLSLTDRCQLKQLMSCNPLPASGSKNYIHKNTRQILIHWFPSHPPPPKKNFNHNEHVKATIRLRFLLIFKFYISALVNLILIHIEVNRNVDGYILKYRLWQPEYRMCHSNEYHFWHSGCQWMIFE